MLGTLGNFDFQVSDANNDIATFLIDQFNANPKLPFETLVKRCIVNLKSEPFLLRRVFLNALQYSSGFFCSNVFFVFGLVISMEIEQRYLASYKFLKTFCISCLTKIMMVSRTDIKKFKGISLLHS